MKPITPADHYVASERHDKMDWKSKLQDASNFGQKALNHRAEEIIEEHWPQVKSLFEEKVGPAALAAAQDDGRMELLFKTVYALLPFPVHLAVKEPAFVKFCFDNRERLLTTVQSSVGATE
jgi:hypothetical protein